MKKSHILIIVLIGVGIGIIITTAGDTSTYVDFGEAYEMASAGNKKEIHVVGQLKKNTNGQVVGIEEGADKVSFSFLMIDDNGREQLIYYNQPIPPDFTRSEKIVVIGSYQGDKFLAGKILLKCPSKYQEQKINV
jgi:cytochrome c-type biogenesis protein CcmE